MIFKKIWKALSNIKNSSKNLFFSKKCKLKKFNLNNKKVKLVGFFKNSLFKY